MTDLDEKSKPAHHGLPGKQYGPPTLHEWLRDHAYEALDFYERLLVHIRSADRRALNNVDVEFMAVKLTQLRNTVSDCDQVIASQQDRIQSLYAQFGHAEEAVQQLSDLRDRSRSTYEAHALPIYAAVSAYRSRGGNGHVKLPLPLPLERNGPPIVPFEQELAAWEMHVMGEDDWVLALHITTGDDDLGEKEPLSYWERVFEGQEKEISQLQVMLDRGRRQLRSFPASILHQREVMAGNRTNRAFMKAQADLVEQCVEAVGMRRNELDKGHLRAPASEEK